LRTRSFHHLHAHTQGNTRKYKDKSVLDNCQKASSSLQKPAFR